MALYGGIRDVRLFRTVNRELIHKIVDSKVDIIKLALSDTETNIYGEAEEKNYYPPVRCHALINPEGQTSDYNDFGVNTKQGTVFTFLRDDLKDANIAIETGDIIHWNETFWEVDNIIENKLLLQRDPDTDKADIERKDGDEYESECDTFGWNYAIVANTHMSAVTRLNFVRHRVGDDPNADKMDIK